MSRATRANPRLAFTAVAVALCYLAACISPPTTYLFDPDGGGADGGTSVTDADALDATTNVPPEDAVVPTCPAACTGGCDGTTCKVKCNGKDACKGGTVACAPGMACIVDCSAGRACDGLAIDQNGASSLCLRCSNGKEACNNVTCSAAAACTKVCTPGNACNKSCDNCATVAACP